MSEAKILVPIKIEALLVDKTTSERKIWKRFAVSYSALTERSGAKLEPGALKELRDKLCEPGIHLHWALPAALTNGVRIDSKMVFPAVPNRWMIIRTSLPGATPEIKKWIVESDCLGSSPKGASPWAIQDVDESYRDVFIGKVTEYKDWIKENDRLKTPLTAMAPGNSTFAAIYQTCRSIFGFYDDVSLVDAAKYSYQVTGWYSDPAIDPLTSAPGKIKDNIISRWSLPTLPTGDSFPTSTICHGLIHTVDWNKSRAYELPLRTTKVNTGVGYTSIEGKCAQMAKQTGAAEKLLSSYFYDALKDVNASAEIEMNADDRGFTGLDGGVLWEIKRTESKNEGKDERPEYPEMSDELNAAFSKLNTEQRKLDRLKQELKSLQLAFRAVSDKIIRDEEEQINKWKPTLEPQQAQLKKDITDIDALIEAAEKEVGRLSGLISEDVNFKETIVDGVKVKGEFELVSKEMPRYWRANDPTVIFSGPGISPSRKYKNPDTTGKLLCRLPKDIVSGIILKDGTNDEKAIPPYTIALGLNPAGSLTADNIAVITRLYGEANLLDPNWGAEWGFAYYNDKTRTNENAKQLGQELIKILNLTDGAKTEKLRGVKCVGGATINEPFTSKAALSRSLEERAVQKWSHPWTPVYLVWYAKWMPAYKIVNGKWAYDATAWAWKDKKYNYAGAAPVRTDMIEYSGKVILTDAITNTLQSRLASLGQHISQAIGSFSDNLQMRKHAIQLPLLKKSGQLIVKDKDNDAYTTDEAYYYPEADANTRNSSNFFPLRAGHMQLTRLWITDAFGQVQQVINYDDATDKVTINGVVYVADNLKSKADSTYMNLSPRIIQPMRLMFRLLKAGKGYEESSSDPGTNPVCGWVMPDRLNRCLNIYDVTGVGLGSLKMIKDDNARGGVRLEWDSVPGAATPTTPDSIASTYLKGFVNGLLGVRDNTNTLIGGEALKLLMNLCTDMALFLSTSSSHQAPGMAGLMGQPLALVRASLKLELQGLPAHPQGWTDSMTETSKKDPPGLSGLTFPVSLGDSRNSKDGLVGYFTDEEGFNKMSLAYGMNTGEKENAYFVKKDISLGIRSDVAPKTITLLMDPRGGVQADCGLLPSKFIDLPHHFVDKGLKNIELHLLVSPFLGAANEPYVPVDETTDRTWTLLRKNAGEWSEMKAGGQNQMRTGAVNGQRIQEGYLVQRAQKK